MTAEEAAELDFLLLRGHMQVSRRPLIFESLPFANHTTTHVELTLSHEVSLLAHLFLCLFLGR